MAAAAPLFWRLLPAVRRGERGRFLFFSALNLLISVAQTVGLAGSEALFLGRLGAQHLPTAFILASISTVGASLVYASVVGKTRNDSLQVAILLGFAASLGVSCLFLWRGDAWVLVALYCAFYVAQAVFINLHFWTFAADFFDTLSSKRLFPLFSVGSSTGGIIGGVLSTLLSQELPTEFLIIRWATGLVLAAILTRLAAQHLRRWTPVGHAEADESSVEGMQNALRFLRRSPLSVGLLFSVVGMVFALFLLQYLYMDIFARTFESPEALARFIGIYLAVSNGIELLVGHSVTPWLIGRLGIAQANLVHPLLTVLTFAALFFDPRLYVAVIARANRELLNDSLASPIRMLTFNALPFRFRGRVRALIDGIVSFGAMSIAGVALLLVGTEVDQRWLVLAGAGAAILYGMANLIVRREYLRSLISELRSGRLDLDELKGDLGGGDFAELAERWPGLLLAELQHPPTTLLEIAPVLAERGFLDPLYAAARHPHPRVRITCLDALAPIPDPRLAALLLSALEDPEVEVCLSALRNADAAQPRSSEMDAQLRRLLEHPEPRVRAAAALRLREDGYTTLSGMVEDAESSEAIAALDTLPLELLDHAIARLDATDPSVRSAALDCVTRLARPHPLSSDELLRELRHPSPQVRAAAARALRANPDPAQAIPIASALDDLTRAVRDESALALAQLGEPGLEAAKTPLGSSRMWTADAAVRAVDSIRSPAAELALGRAFGERVHRAWSALAAQRALPQEDDSLPLRFLRATLESAQTRHCWVAFRILETREDPGVVRSVQKSLGAGTSRQRSDALELLCNLGDRSSSQLLSLLLENGPVEDTLPTVAATLDLPSTFEEVLAEARSSSNRWLRMAADGCLAVRSGAPVEEEKTMENLLALRSVSLFANLSFEQLEAIKKVMKEAQYVEGEAVVTEGERGEDLFVLIEGEARAYKRYGTPEQVYLSTFAPVSYFGEIAILDSAPRSATVVVTKGARLLSLDGDRFKELILQAPEISFEIFRVLTARIRAAEAR